MGLLDAVLGSLGGGQRRGAGNGAMLLTALLALLANRSSAGGLSGLAESFRRGGLGDVIGSWIGTGANLPIRPDQLGAALGLDTLDDLARQAGLSREETADELSQMLPQVVDRLTPEGHVPDAGFGDIDEILGRFR